MIEGLDFIRSWRFWIMLVASTSAVTLGVAGAYIVSALYFPLVDGKPGRLYHLLVALAFFLPFVGLVWFFFRREAQVAHYSEDHRLRLIAGVAVAAAIVATIEDLVVTLFFLVPVLGANANQHLTIIFALFFGMGFGQDIAAKEQAKMMGYDYGEGGESGS